MGEAKFSMNLTAVAAATLHPVSRLGALDEALVCLNNWLSPHNVYVWGVFD